MKKNPTFLGIHRELELSYGEKIRLDAKDKKILELLSRDGRMSITSIAHEVELSPDGTKYRLDRLLKEHVIAGFTAVVNPPKIGLPLYACVWMSLWNHTPEKENEFIKYLRSASYIVYAMKTLGQWDVGLEIYAKDAGHLDEILAQMRARFSDIIKEIMVVPVIKEYKWTEFPRMP